MTIRKFGKVGVLFLALVLALGGVGAAFASWTDTLTIGGTVNTGVLEWEIVSAGQAGDPGDDINVFWDLKDLYYVQMDKDVANTTVTIVDPHTLSVVINNAYPYYSNHITLRAHALGTIPLRIWKVNFLEDDTLVATFYNQDEEFVYLDLDGDDVDDFEIWWGDSFGLQRHYCQNADLSFEILVLQPMAQDQQGLSFTIEIVAIQWNEYVEGPLLP